MTNPIKAALKETLLDLGLYHKINDFRFRSDDRNRSQQDFYSRVIKNTDLVFDVGANIGQRTQIFSQLASSVVAIEPQPNCIRHLKSRFRFNKKVKIEPVAVGATSGEATMWQSDSPGISSMSAKFIDTMGQSVFSDQRWDVEITVPVKTIDDLIDIHGKPHFLKIDVEGYELDVLKGLAYPVPFISFEYTPAMVDDAKACLARVNELSSSYRYNYCLGEDLDFVLPKHVDYSTFMNTTIDEISKSDTFGDIYVIQQT